MADPALRLYDFSPKSISSLAECLPPTVRGQVQWFSRAMRDEFTEPIRALSTVSEFENQFLDLAARFFNFSARLTQLVPQLLDAEFLETAGINLPDRFAERRESVQDSIFSRVAPSDRFAADALVDCWTLMAEVTDTIIFQMAASAAARQQLLDEAEQYLNTNILAELTHGNGSAFLRLQCLTTAAIDAVEDERELPPLFLYWCDTLYKEYFRAIEQLGDSFTQHVKSLSPIGFTTREWRNRWAENLAKTLSDDDVRSMPRLELDAEEMEN